MNYIEEHPYLVGSLVLVAIVGFLLLRGGSSSDASTTQTSAPGVSPTVQAAQIASATSLQESTNAATVATNQIGEQLAAKQIDANVALVTAQLTNQTNLQAIISGAQSSAHQDDTSLAIAQTQVGGQIQLAREQGSAAVDALNAQYAGQASLATANYAGQATLANIDRSKNQDTLYAGIENAKITSTTALTLNSQNIEGNLQYAGIQSDLEKYKTDAAVKQTGIIEQATTDQNTANANLQAYLATLTSGVNLAGIAEKGHENDNLTTVQNNYINTAGAVAVNDSNNATAVKLQTGSTLSTFLNQFIGPATVQNERSSGGIAQILSSLFGTAQPNIPSSGFNISIPGIGSVGVSNP